jgi:hypothetical protein
MGMYYEGGGSHSTQGPPSYRVWGGGEGASTHLCPTYNQMHAGLSFSYSPISVLLRQPLSIKKSYAGAVQLEIKGTVQLDWICMRVAPWIGLEKDINVDRLLIFLFQLKI